MKVIIIGGVAGGATCATRLRRLDEKSEIVIYEKTNFISYANCGLPYYVGNVIQDEEDLTLQTPNSFYARYKILAKVLHEVIEIDTKNKTVTVKNLKTNEIFIDNYDKLVLSTGAKAIIPNQYVKNRDKIFTLKTVEDTLQIKKYVDEHKPKSAVVAGVGYIGFEIAENLKERGIDVTILQRGNKLLPPLDFDMACFLHAKIRENGIKLKLNTSLENIEEQDKTLTIKTNEEDINTDMLILALGVTPDTYLAKLAGINTGIKGAIIVDEFMQTSVKDVYAVGDAIEVKHVVTSDKTWIALAGPANKQGRIVADNICGINSKYFGSLGASILKIFDMTVGTVGINETTAKNLNLKYGKVYLSPSNHASYYPGASAMNIKVLYDASTLKILGAQILGYDGVDKRIDVLATAICLNSDAITLKNLDLAYAPPYSSAKDPVNIIGYIIENEVNGIIKQYYIEDIPDLQKNDNVTLLDVRTKEEFYFGKVDGYINVPVDELRDNLDKLDKTKPIYVICQSGIRSYTACRILSGNGFNCYNFAGGYRFYATVSKETSASKSTFPCGKDKK